MAPSPRAAFQLEQTSAQGAAQCAPSAVAVQDQSLGGPLEYRWDYGDGGRSTAAAPPAHTYRNFGAAPAEYALQLAVRNAAGCQDSARQRVRVAPEVKAHFVLEAPEPPCSPLLVTFRNGSTHADRYEWAFGDGKTGTSPNPTHTYSTALLEPETFSAQLRASSDYGCQATWQEQLTLYPTPAAAFTVTPARQQYSDAHQARVEVTNTSSPLAPAWEYLWDWGDGTTSASPDPGFHLYQGRWGDPQAGYALPIALTVRNARCQARDEQRVVITPPEVQARFTGNRDRQCPPMTVRMKNLSKYATRYVWHFGAGPEGRVEGFEPEWTFRTAGSHYVQLEAYGEGGKATYYLRFQVLDTPRVAFRVAPTTVRLPEARVAALNLTEGGQDYRWDFGDGAQSSEPVSYTHLTLPTILRSCRSRWSPYH